MSIQSFSIIVVFIIEHTDYLITGIFMGIYTLKYAHFSSRVAVIYFININLLKSELKSFSKSEQQKKGKKEKGFLGRKLRTV